VRSLPSDNSFRLRRCSNNPVTIINSLNTPPENYTTPPFPSLYWPFPLQDGYSVNAYYLYRTTDIWRFTVIWTLLFFGAVHMAASGYAVAMLRRSWQLAWIIPVLYAVIAGIEAFLAGSMVGGLLGALYNAARARMSTWIPFVWGLTSTLILVLGGFAIRGGM
jgi:hypothetical protein